MQNLGGVLESRRVAVATDVTTRLLISHIILPSEPIESVVDQVSDLALTYLTAPTRS